MTSFMTANGLSIKRQNDILNEMLADAQIAFKDDTDPIDTSANSVLGNFLNIFASEMADIWNGLQEVYDAFNPSINEDKNLDDSCALSGITRLQPSNTVTEVTLTGDPGTKIPVGFNLKCSLNNEIFSNKDEVIIDSTGNVKILFYANNTGEILCPPEALSIIPTPLAGLKSAINKDQPKSIGRDRESDTELRLRRSKSGPINGQNVKLSLQAKLSDIVGVTSADVIDNCTEKVSPEGIQPHSFEVIIQGGDDNQIAQVIWQNKPSGIPSNGDISISVIDSNGEPQTISFSRPIDVPIAVNVTYSINPDELFPQNGEELIKEAVENYGNALGINKDIIGQRFFGSIFSNCPGIENLNIQVKRKSDPTFSNSIVIGKREYGTFDPNDIVVVKNV